MTDPTLNQPKSFHARIFRLYIGYLQDKLFWDDKRVNDLLARLDTSSERLSSDSTWYNLDFADRFYNLMMEETGDPKIAFHAGVYIKKNAFSAIIYYLMRGLVSVGRLYQLVSKFTPYFTKAATMNVIEIHEDSAVIESVPNEGYQERAYMCENRRGILTGLPQVFDLPLATIEETECLHEGGRKCLYSLKWKERSHRRWILAVATVTVLTALATWNFLNSVLAALSTLCCLLISVAAAVIKQIQFQKKELFLQNQVMETALKDIERKNQEMELVGRISRLTHSLMSPEELAQTLVRSVCQLLRYDRAILLITDMNRQVLEVSAHHGFSDEMKELLEQTEFNIRPDNTTGFFVKVVNTKSPVLIADMEKHIQHLSPRSQMFAKTLGAKSFVAVPLKDPAQNILGVLAVDYIDIAKRMSVTDQDLLMTLADHLAISLHNANMLNQLEENLEISRRYSRDQQHLRETFQRFLPKDLASELLNSPSDDFLQRLLSRVKKKPAAVLFCDIFKFSEIAEKLESEDVIDLLNTIFTDLEPFISAHHGFIDKFTGDGFIAVFEDRECCLKACSAAGMMVKSIATINQKLYDKNYPKIEMGIGINYGNVILGNVGSADRLNFTVIGDTVNLAQRLESHTRQLGPNTICVSAAVKHQCEANMPLNTKNDLFDWTDLGGILVKGHSDPIRAFSLKPKPSEQLPASSQNQPS